MEIAVATNNVHKVSELREILPSHRLFVPSDMGVSLSVAETGKSFLENAFLKAEGLYQALSSTSRISEQGTPFNSLPVLADDSGLVVDALHPKMGLYSARYGAEEGVSTDEGRLSLLIEEMQDATNRSARYVCAMVLFVSTEVFYTAQTLWRGKLAKDASSGSTGFGYDPVFIPHNFRTPVSELSKEEKHRYSHRGQAARAVLRMLDA